MPPKCAAKCPDPGYSLEVLKTGSILDVVRHFLDINAKSFNKQLKASAKLLIAGEIP